MFRNEKLEIKVGIFIGIGIFIAFLIVFSISDLYVFKDGYNIEVRFDYVNGISQNSPVRLAGVHVGEVKDIDIYYDEAEKKTYVKLNVRIMAATKIEENAIARINTLGFLGEQYLEISPGTGEVFLKNGDKVIGRNPANVGQQMERMTQIMDSASEITESIKNGKGTLGKLLYDENLYDQLDGILTRLNEGHGTLGKLLVDETIYNNVEELVVDVKENPWKLLHKRTDRKKRSQETVEGTNISPR